MIKQDECALFEIPPVIGEMFKRASMVASAIRILLQMPANWNVLLLQKAPATKGTTSTSDLYRGVNG